MSRSAVDARHKLFLELYGSDQEALQIRRYGQLLKKYEEFFGGEEAQLFSAPGRTEIGGNHTDHNHGRVLAAAVNLDAIAVAAPTNNDLVTIYSDRYPDPFEVSLRDLAPHKNEERTTSALIRGIAARFQALGYAIGGFNACLSSNVMIGSGLSSSACLEVLLGTIMNVFYNEGKLPALELARIGQYAENVYFKKPCGLMDQITCALGGIVAIDFEDPGKPAIKKINFDFAAHQHSVVVLNTGRSHADLTDDYAAIPAEMKSVAGRLGKKVCRDISLKNVIDHCRELRAQVGDRALLRALHFLHENQRVVRQVETLEMGDFASFLALVRASGNSSWKWLQNCTSPQDPTEQSIALALALTEDFLKEENSGACRVHGGGFAGTIQVFLPETQVSPYTNLMEPIFGEGAVSVLRIRSRGVLHVSAEKMH